jgi:ornithine carbamoyltransferase
VSPTFQRRLLSSSPIDALDARALVATARALRRNRSDVTASTAPLRGKNIALMCSVPGCDCARDFDEAASELGARVARIEPEADWLRDDAHVGRDAARLLEHLYDAVGCEEVPPGFAQRLQEDISVPVYDRLARGDHPVFGLLTEVADPGVAPGPEERRALLQAVLVRTLA